MMTPEQFCYWLQGLLECRPENDSLTLQETKAVRDHLNLVFTKVTPDRRETHRTKLLNDAITATKRTC